MLTIIAAVTTLLLIPSCGGSKAVKEEAYDPEKFLQKADAKTADKEYEEARKILLEVKNRDTSKKYAPMAQLKLADTYIKDEDIEPGIEEYRKFLDQYPTNQNASYAQYQIAMAYFNQIESPDRGSGAARKALHEFIRLKELFPRNPYREIIELRIGKCRNIMAEGEFMVGEFYYNKESCQAAIARFENLLKQYPEYSHADEALLLTGKCYKIMKKGDKAKEAFARLIEKYPSSKLAAEARKGL